MKKGFYLIQCISQVLKFRCRAVIERGTSKDSNFLFHGKDITEYNNKFHQVKR